MSASFGAAKVHRKVIKLCLYSFR